jgi:hypothetical protein
MGYYELAELVYESYQEYIESLAEGIKSKG